MKAAVLLLGCALVACVDSAVVKCGDGSVCPAGQQCRTYGCVLESQVTACNGIADGDACTSPTITGQCLEAACVAVGCGNHIVEAGEACDDGNTLGGDGCSARCDSDETCGNAFLDTAKSEGCDCGGADFTGTRPPACNGKPNSSAPDAVCTDTCQIRGCGDGVVGGLEDCDGAAQPLTACADVGFYSGALGCLPSCRYDTAACSGRCNDGTRNGPSGGSVEDCDTTDLASKDCTDFGYYNPAGLACNQLCGFDVAACTGFCGDGTYQSGNEACEPGETEQALANRGLDCTDFGFYSAAGLRCSSACQIDTSMCGGGRCGDATRQASEDCDAADLNGKTCTNFGYYTSAGLGCRANCTFDFAACTQRCGDGMKNGPEQCDGSVGALTCQDFGYYAGGPVTCNASCGYDTSLCTQRCGDNVVNGTEQCDGSVGGLTCMNFGFYAAGTLQCTGCAYDTAMCTQRCGDGARNGPEQCDTMDLGGNDCMDFGFYQASGLKCSGACSFDTAMCAHKCGDNMLDAPQEDCDGPQLGGVDCTDFGFYNTSGLTCSGGCTHDTSACVGRCGDDRVNGPESCDGAPPAALACAFSGSGDAGQLGCSSGCYDTSEHCRSISIEPEYPGITSGTLLDVWGSGREFFAVGTGGVIVHTSGGAWTSTQTSGGLKLSGVWGATPTDVFAAGDALSGTQFGIFHYNGTAWSTMTAPTTGVQHLTDVYGAASNDVWAVGNGGIVLRYQGTWVTQTTPIGATNLNGVWASGSTVFVVGNTGAIWRYNGSWTNQTIATAEHIIGVWGVSASEVYAITQTTVYRYNGTSWSAMSSSCPNVSNRGVGGMPGGPVFIAGWDSATLTEGRMCQLAGGQWQPLTVPGSGILYSVAGSSERIYAVGNPSVVGGSGANWLSIGTIASPQFYNGIWGSASDNLYVVGSTSTSVEHVARWNGSAWAVQTTPNGSFDLADVFGGTAWAVAVGTGGRVLASNGTGGAWAAQTSNTANALKGVWGDSAGTTVYAVGATGTITVRTSGTWAVAASTTTNQLNAVWGVGTSVFAVGNAGTIVRKVGAGAFAAMTSPTTQNLYDVWGASATDVYTVGDGGVFHYNGTAWVALPSGRGFAGVWGASGDVFVYATNSVYQIVGGRVLPVRLEIPNFFVADVSGTNDLTWFMRSGNFETVLPLAGRLFRSPATETVCDDFWDDDADGLADCADPECAANPVCTTLGGSCQPLATAACAATTPGTTIGGATRWPSYGPGCNTGRDEGGTESFYVVRRPTAGMISLTLSGFGGNDLDVIVPTMSATGACLPEKSCLAAAQTAASSEVTSFMAAANTDYVVIVDGPQGTASNFNLMVSCP